MANDERNSELNIVERFIFFAIILAIYLRKFGVRSQKYFQVAHGIQKFKINRRKEVRWI